MVPKGLLSFLVFFYAMRSLVPVGYVWNISRHLFTWLVCGSFQWHHGLLLTDCIVWDDKDKVIGFKRSHFIRLGWWSTGSPRLQLFQLSQQSHVTNRWFFFRLLSMKYDINFSPTNRTLWDDRKFFPSCRVSHWWTISTASFVDALHTGVRHWGEKFYCRTVNSKVDTVTSSL